MNSSKSKSLADVHDADSHIASLAVPLSRGAGIAPQHSEIGLECIGEDPESTE